MGFLTDPVSMLVLGVLTHFCQVLSTSYVDGRPIKPIRYWRMYPYHSILAVIAAVVGYAALDATGRLDALSAFGAGYMANSLSDLLGTRAKDAT